MPKDEPPEISLEFKGGLMTIRTPDAVYEVKVTNLIEGARLLPPLADRPALPGAPPSAEVSPWTDPHAPPSASGETSPALREAAPALPSLSADREFYDAISHDFFRELGSLTRRLASSLVKLARAEEKHNGSSGGVAQEMGEALGKAREIVSQLRAVEQDDRQAQRQLTWSEGPVRPPFKALGQVAAALRRELAASRGAAAEALAGLSLDQFLQALYEHCANQTVRKHIRAMAQEAEAFEQDRLRRGLDGLAAMAQLRERELILPLLPVLHTLEAATDSERFRQVLVKMQGTAEQIFPDLELPLPSPDGVEAPPPPSTQLLSRLDKLLEQVGQAASALPESGAGEEDFSQGLAQAQHLGRLERSLQGLQDMVEGMGGMTGGRHDRQMMRLLGDLLVQMLVVLVSTGAKLQAKEAQLGLDNEQAELAAQQQVDRALQQLAPNQEPAPGRPSLPDLKAAQELLEKLGF
ncbi:MAG: hypothetical protein C4525_14840 [Desulfarculus sp.]|nr:MAG: hypothetical protein C4525_14840 [Desulfarculus sp.]